MFASSIPEIIELVGSGSKYGGELKREHGKRYIKHNEDQKKVYQLFQSIQPRMFEKMKSLPKLCYPTVFYLRLPFSSLKMTKTRPTFDLNLF